MRGTCWVCVCLRVLWAPRAEPAPTERPFHLAYMLPRIQSPADLVSNHLHAAIDLLPALPPSADLPVLQQGGVFVFGDGTLPAEWLDALGQVDRGGVALYEIHACEDESTRERILFGKDGKTLWSAAAPPGYDPAAAAHAWWPWLANLSKDAPERLWYEAVYDPARVVSQYVLLPDASLDEYVEVLEAERAQALASAAAMRSLDADPDAFLVIGIVRTNATSVTLALQFPPDFTNRVDLFGIDSLTGFPWQLLATTAPVTAQTAEVTLAWTGDAGFFRAGDADTDTDGDGLPDTRETLLYGTDSDVADTDGDRLPDGWEIACGLDPFADDAMADPDQDRVPNLYEYIHGTDPTQPDNHLIATMRVNPAAAVTNAGFYATIKAAIAASTPYAVIEVADGLYSGPNNAGLWFPAHPVLLMSENWGASRRATISYAGNLAAFYMNARQDNRTIVRGLNLLLGGENAYQIGFWLGDGGIVAPDKGSAPVFEGVTVELGASNVNVGFFCRHSVPGTVRFENCVIRGKRNSFKPMRGIYAIDSPALRLVNCTFQDFSPEPYSYGIQFESTGYNNGSADNPVDVDLVNCAWDESFTHPNVHAFVRIEQGVAYHVSLTNSLAPRALDWFPPDVQSGLIITNANLAMGGHLRSGSPAINAGFAAAPPLDFEGHTRDVAPDIGADEYAGFAAGDSDGDGIDDDVEVETYGTNPYAVDSDGDTVSDSDELADGTDPSDHRSVNRLVSVTVVNRISAALTNVVSYAFDDAPAMGVNSVTQFMGNASFSFPFSFTPGTTLWVKAACDMNRDGEIGPALEPVYRVPFLTIFPQVSIEIDDFDGDSVSDWLENLYGSSPTNPASCYVTVSGTLTNLYSDTCTNHVTYGFTSAGWNESAAVEIVKGGDFCFPSVPVNGAQIIHAKAFCDLDGDGVRDAATEPLYTAAVTDFTRPTASLRISDFDGDGVPDPEENAEGTDPANGNNYCFSVGGAFTNLLTLEADIRLAFERVQGGATSTLADFAPTNGPFAMPHTVTTVPAAWRLRCYSDDDDNHAYDTNEFSRVYGLTRQHHDVRCDITVTDLTFDTDGDGLPDLWERRYDAVTIGISDALDDPDGAWLINLHEYYSGTNPGGADVTTNTSALANATFVIDSRIAGRNPTNALPLFENYLANGANGVFIRNTNCWAADLDLTCCSPWNNHLGNKMAGTLISPRHVLFAAHYDQIPTNRTLTFVDRQTNVITRTLMAKKRHQMFNNIDYPDLTVGLLNADVPTNQISFARVLPDDYADYIRDGERLPAIRLDQEEKALVGDVRYVTAQVGDAITSCIVPGDPTRLAFFEPLIGSDSGNPAFILFNGQSVLLTLWTLGGAGSGTSVTALKADINQLMGDLGGGYQLTEVDLTIYTPLP